MTVREVMENVNVFLQLHLDERAFLEGEENRERAERAADEPQMKLLLRCLHYVLEEIFLTFPVRHRQKVRAEENFLPFSAFSSPPLEILSLTDGVGRPVKFRYSEEGVFTDANGMMEAVYAEKSRDLSFFDEVVTAVPKLDARILAYGVAAEYCLLNGDSDGVKIYDGRFRDALSRLTPPPKTMPARRWL